MTWLKGSSTLGALAPKLTQLICGEVADDVGNTCASGDQWVRENVGRDTIRTPASKDYTPAVWQMRTGYFSLVCVPNQVKSTIPAPGYNRNLAGGSGSVCQVTTPYSSVPGTATHNRWLVQVKVRTANTTPGDYSTGRIDLQVYDADSGAASGPLSNQILSSSGSFTYTNGLVIKVTDPSGTLTVNTEWCRGFTSVYMYGVDYFPWWARRGNGVTSPTWTTAPPGVSGTDYDIIDQGYPEVTRQLGLASTVLDTGGFLSGLGIKTATGLGAGTLYSGTYPIAFMKCRVFASATLGQFSLDPGPSVFNAVDSSLKVSGCGSTMANWAQCIQTPASASSSTAVQYFISVKADGIFLVLNADPAGTGKLGTSYVGTFTPNDPTYDKFPVYYNQPPQQFITNSVVDALSGSAAVEYFLQKRMINDAIAVVVGTATSTTSTTLVDTLATRTTNQDVGLVIYAGSSYGTVTANTPNTWTVSAWTGGTPSGTATYKIQRDWQTGFHRYDFVTANVFRYGLSEAPVLLAMQNGITNSNLATSYGWPISQAKPATNDDKWWLYGVNYVEGSTLNNSAATENGSFYRGYQSTRFFFIPGTGWGNGDELTDSISGAKFFLLTPDYCAAAQRVNVATNVYVGGVAIAEL